MDPNYRMYTKTIQKYRMDAKYRMHTKYRLYPKYKLYPKTERMQNS